MIFANKHALIVLIVLPVIACSPKFDWREIQKEEYRVLMPSKPSELSREIRLGSNTVTMHMTAVQIDGVSFAVGAINMTDETQAQLAVTLIKNALLTNLGGILTQEKTSAVTVNGKLTVSDEFSAVNKATSTHMLGRIVARRNWVFEVLVAGPKQAIDQDAAETFLSSFNAI